MAKYSVTRPHKDLEDRQIEGRIKKLNNRMRGLLKDLEALRREKKARE